MFEKDFENKIKELIELYNNAREKGTLSLFDDQKLEKIFFYYFDQLDYENALQVVDDGIEYFYYSSIFFNHKAEVLKELGQYNEALEILDQAEAISPNDISILLNKVDVFSIMKQFDDAVEILSEALHRKSGIEKAELYLELADVWEDAEKYDKVIESLISCLNIDSENEEALNRIWFSVELTETYDKSIEFHKTLIEKNPYNYLAWNNLAHAFNGLKHYEKAINAFEFVMAINEIYEQAYIDCADCYYNLKKYNKAIDLYTEVLDITSHQKETYFNIGRCYDELEDFKQSRDFYKEALSIDPYYTKAYYKIGRTYLLSDLPKNALKPLEKAHKLDSKNLDYQITLADVYLMLKEHEKALGLYKEILKNNDSNKQIHLNLITIIYESGNLAGAIEHIESIEDNFEDISDLLYIKVAFLYELDKIEEASLALLDALNYNQDMSKLLIDLLPEIALDKEFMKIISNFSK